MVSLSKPTLEALAGIISGGNASAIAEQTTAILAALSAAGVIASPAAATQAYVDIHDAITLSNANAFTNAAIAAIPGLIYSVISVSGRTGVVILTSADVGLGNVDNTSDLAKPVSVAQAYADAAVQAFSIQRVNHTGTQLLATISDAGTAAAKNIPSSGDASVTEVVYGTDTRLSDSRTPVAHASTHAAAGSDPVTLAQSQVTNLVSDLALKAPSASPALTGIPLSPTAASGTNTTQIATTAFVISEVASYVAPVTSVAGRTGAIVLTYVDIGGLGSLATLNNAPAGTLTGTTLNATVVISSLTAVGTIVTGVWQATAIVDAYIASSATWNAKQAAITFGTGVLTALGINIGTAGSPVVNGGVLGTPSSGVATNLTGTAAGLTAGAATALATPRAINGVNFDGTAPITVTAAANTLTGTSLPSGVTGSSLTSAAGGTFGTAAFTAATAYATAAQGATADSAAQKSANLSDLASAATARTNLTVRPYGRVTISNADATVAATSVYVGQVGTMSAPRVVTLPAASAVPAGWELVVADESGTVSSTNTLTVTRAGSDTVNGATTVVLAAAYGWRRFISNGSNAWVFDGGVLRAANNLSDVSSASTSRTNLGLGTLATQSGTFSGTSSGTNTGDQTITLTGQASGTGTGSFAVTLDNAAVIAKVLTGYVFGAGGVVATDSIIQALQKIDGNDAQKATRQLDNLSGTVAINLSLLTGTTNTIDIGSVLKAWRTGYFNTSVISPSVVGGSGTTQTLTLQSTSGVGATGADIVMLVGNNGATRALRAFNNGTVAVGATGTPTYQLEVYGALTSGVDSVLRINSAADYVGLAINATKSTGRGMLLFQRNGTLIYEIAVDLGNTGINDFSLYNQTSGSTGLYINVAEDVLLGSTGGATNSGGFFGGQIMTLKASTRRVGINAVAPQRTLDISTTGQMTFGDDVTSGSTATGIFWYSGTTYGIFRSAVSWSAPAYAQLNIKWQTGIVIDGGSTGTSTESGCAIQPSGGNVGIGRIASTATSRLHLAAGTATAGTSPLGFTSGTLLTTPVAGKVEFLTDAWYGTITTGAVRKTFAFLESPSFTGTVNSAGVIIAGAQVRLKGYTVATLPSGTQGDKAFVTDALAPTYLTAVIGGGAVVTEVFYNGSTYIAT